MTPETVITIGQQAMQVAALLAAPLLLSSLVIGLAIGVFQAATQINEMTLSFIPKLIVIMVVLMMFGNWMLATMMNFMRTLYESIPFLIG
ncbi:MAG: flagellar biosynthesis protein FliQ [Gammaproteobacteria bacterium]|jgi:flagellar biosynthetic protein FliQ|nr:flagellar biosynthesis protein FliQ [Gammaproteobacteria bacterium]MBT4607300.1 flagellar biosynthesis protein FliQ [Thiotrichales bacterium]MBT3473855.1 flagellar biosynthesis protein FliQ [Gammaproteobacteria bacterium]MBT3892539.1 flagellar biosynthesis protein FliQ [Gammaproteobacteria bacterium]MBT3966195.1 flagellar biosynthesis protein FliQ [Gammaproteobacteria bacterium]